jgi:hypothetical protein
VLIEPTPALPPPTRGGRWRLLLAVVAPAVLLAGVIGAGTLAVDGATDRAAPDPSASPIAALAPPPSPTPAEESPAPGTVDLAAAFPARVQGLPTRTVSDVLERRRDGSLDDALQAVMGYLTVQPGTFDCFWGDETGATLPMVQAVGCRREVVLAETADPVLGWSGSEVVWLARPGPAHLHAPVFHGVSLGSFEPLVSARPPMSASVGDDGLEPAPIRPEPVLLIGRFGDPRVADPRTNSDHRSETFALERLVRSVDGLEERPAIRLITPPSGSAPIEVVRASVAAESRGSVILSHAFLELRQLADLDLGARDAARTALERAGVTTDERSGVWYVRVMVRDGQPVAALAGDRLPRRLGWVVLGADGSVLASALER